MVGVMIGSGIFRTPTSIAQELGSPAVILAFWVLGGFICWCGAMTYAELGVMHPKSGGTYVFLHEGFGPLAAFVFGWTYMLISQPMALGGITTVFSEHFNLIAGVQWDTRIVTCAVIILLTALNTVGMRLGAGVAMLLTSLKAGALLLIVVLAVILLKGDAANFTPQPAPHPLWLAVAPVMAAVLWTYDGWSNAVAIGEEIKEPQRRIPRIFLLGTIGICALYVAINAVYFWLMPLDEMRTTETVAPIVMQRLIGDAGALLVTVVVLISTLGATHASIIVGSRVIFAQARDRLFFSFPARVHPTFHTPAVALWMQAALACLAVIWLERFEALMGGYIFTMWVFYGLSAAAIFVLRTRQPDAERAFRCVGYPFTPIIFVGAAIGMTILSIMESPAATLPWLAILLGGAPAYWLWRRIAA